MKDMLMEIYNALIVNSFIKTNVGDYAIKFYDLPETFDTSKPFILLVPLGPIETGAYASDKELTQVLTYQINVESTNRMLTKEIQKNVKQTLFSLGFSQLSGGLDEYFTETKRYVDARRYRKQTKIYDTNY